MTRLVTDSSDVFCGDGEIEKLGKNSQQNAFIAQKKKKRKPIYGQKCCLIHSKSIFIRD